MGLDKRRGLIVPFEPHFLVVLHFPLASPLLSSVPHLLPGSLSQKPDILIPTSREILLPPLSLAQV
jgi:hypothetical protein